ncbi:hypothetical protein [Caballeronia udeis]|uniref:hypothetical protein n=1 Tax=Caballeronia udeis TaxID=1232866 RepID=UPI0007828B2E|nr:hypothetical protein [Caballeronia udeis]
MALLLPDVKSVPAYPAHGMYCGQADSLPRSREVVCRGFQSIDYAQADVLRHRSPEELWQESHLNHDVDRLSTHACFFRPTAFCTGSLH